MDKLVKIVKKDDGSIVLTIEREDGTREEVELGMRDVAIVKQGIERIVRPGGDNV